MNTNTRKLHDLGQRLWLDNITHEMLNNGTLARYIAELSVKVEGLDSHTDGERIAEIARRGGREQVGCIVLGRGADEAKVRGWLAVAAGVPGFIGFAVGRTSFWDAVSGYRAQMLTRAEAATQIAGRLREWVDVFESGRLASVACANPMAMVSARPASE